MRIGSEVKAYKTKTKAILWLHLVRLERYKYGFLNMILTNMLWYMLFLLGALMFIPEGEFQLFAIITFWGVVLWSMMNNSVWLIAGWTWFVIATGIIEEHIVCGVNPLALIMGRFVTGFTVSLIAIPIIALVFTGLAGLALFNIYSIVFLLLGIGLLLAYSSLYAIVLAALSLRTHVPGVMLDIVNIFMYIIGGIGVPVSRMPSGLREIALLLPYTHAAELTRYGAVGLEPYIGIATEVIVSILYLLLMATIAYIVVKRVEEYIKKHGVKGVGRM
ncbi:ABC transporter permease [Desulfurococcaceae archaeon MEX13E-LK6-19]|nr:ABC transporter permease [Desulfurococcaceae archaeon MEX13E-LK6-19]